jgi:hypothetical protein
VSSRDELIARKVETQARLSRTRRELEAARERLDAASGVRRRVLVWRMGALESTVEQLMAEEMRLRLEIDRAAR